MNSEHDRPDVDAGLKLGSFELVANVSLLFAEFPLLDRFPAAADSGFKAVEAWWPFATPSPPDAEVERFLQAITAADLRLTALNLFAGDMTKGDRGILNRPDRREEFLLNLDLVADIAAETGCRLFNALYGQQIDGLAGQEQAALENLLTAVDKLAPYDGTVLIEPLSRGLNGAYPIQTARDAIEIVEAVRRQADVGRAAILFDTFHLANNGEDLLTVLRTHTPDIGHVQLADTPGRGEPGSGNINFPGLLQALSDNGYAGLIACEYSPTGPTKTSLGWIPREHGPMSQ